MGLVFRLLIPLFVFVATGTLFISVVPAVGQRVRSMLDRLLLGLLAGMALYMLGATVLNALFRVKLTPLSVAATFILACGGMGYVAWKRRANLLGERNWAQVAVLAALLVIFALAIYNRLGDTRRYPDRLLNADPYRHHDRTRALIETGYLSRWDSHIYGKVPLLEMQGAYVLPAVISMLSGVDAWHLWKYGSIVMGALSIFGTYLLAKYSFKGNWAAGVLAAGFLAASPIHILRTNMGFSEAWALPFLPVALLSFLFLTDDLRYGHAFFFGLFYTALAMANPIPAVFLVLVLALYGLVMLAEKRKRIRLVIGIAISAAMFFGIVGIWATTYLGVTPAVGVTISSGAGTAGIAKEMSAEESVKLFRDNVGGAAPTFSSLIRAKKEKSAWLLAQLYTWFTTGLAVVGLGALFVDRRKEVGPGAVNFSYSRVFQLLFFCTFIAYAVLVRMTFPLPGGRVFSIPSFTSKIYRYYLLPSWSVSLLAGWVLVAGSDGLSRLSFRRNEKARKRARLVFNIVLVVVVTASYTTNPAIWGRSAMADLSVHPRVWGHWGMNCTEEEYRAADWISARTPEDALIITHWYTGDYIRSLTGRTIVLADGAEGSLRPGVRALKEMGKLDIPMLSSRRPEGMVKFSSEHEEEVYILTSQWQTVREFSGADGFTKVFDYEVEFDDYDGGTRKWNAPEKRVRIYRVEKDGKAKPARVEGNLAFGARAIGGASTGEIKSLDRIADGSLGGNADAGAAYSQPLWEEPGTGWFGLDFGEEREVSSIGVAFGMYSHPELLDRPQPQLQYVPLNYQFQYWSGSEWEDLPGGSFKGMQSPKLNVVFEPVITQKVRVLITKMRSSTGQTTRGYYRAAVLELAAYSPIE
jgi:hypothetical protein